MIKGLIYKYLLKAILVVLLGLILYGIFSGSLLAIILFLFVFLQLSALLMEAQRAGGYPSPEMVARPLYPPSPAPMDSKLPARAPGQGVHGAPPPPAVVRSRRELFAEALGVIGFALLLPLVIALYTCDIFSVDARHGWLAALVVLGCLGLYAWPRWVRSSVVSEHFRITWWATAFMAGVLMLPQVIQIRHPYLNPFNPEHNRLAAERVLSLKNNIVAGRYAAWVTAYAQELDRRGEKQQAIAYYRKALQLEPNQPEAASRLAMLEAPASNAAPATSTSPPQDSSASYWTTNHPIAPQPRHHIDAGLDHVAGCTVVIVPMGEVPDSLLDAVGFGIHKELGLPVVVSPDRIPLPHYTRKRGLAMPPQWHPTPLIIAFTNATAYYPRAPIHYLFITTADIYSEQANYVFSASWSWGAVVSAARFGWPDGDPERIRQRTTKQSLCALIKSYGVPASTDQKDVTSYANGLQEFDAKGNRPDAETLRLFHQAVDRINRGWLAYERLHGIQSLEGFHANSSGDGSNQQ